MTTFERSEYLDRMARAKKRMEAVGLDLLLVNDPANMCYLSGYNAWSYYTHQVLVVSPDSEEPIWIGRGMDATCGHATCWTKHENIVGYPDHYVQSTERHPMDWMSQWLTDRGWGGGTIGVEMDSYFYSALAHKRLVAGLPNAKFKDATGLVNWARVVKSPAEIALMKRAGKLVELAMKAAVDNIVPGNRECDAVGEILYAGIKGTEEFGGDYTAIMPLLPTGKGTSAPHITWSNKPFETGNGTIIEIAGCHERYHCPMARTVYLGTPPKDVSDTAKVVVEGLAAALDAVRPGVVAEEVEAAWRGVIAKHGIVKDSRIGYSTGLNFPPDWGEHTVSLRPGDRTELQPGMTLHCIPGVWGKAWGIEVSECFHVTDKGAVPFASYPRDLVVKA